MFMIKVQSLQPQLRKYPAAGMHAGKDAQSILCLSLVQLLLLPSPCTVEGCKTSDRCIACKDKQGDLPMAGVRGCSCVFTE